MHSTLNILRKDVVITPFRPTSRDLFILIVILIIGAVVRFTNPEAMDWSKDHSDMVMLIEHMRDTNQIFFVGQPSSARITHSPFYIYPLVVPYLITDGNVVITTMFISTLNLIGVAILWYLTYRYFGATAALIAALAYALNPWAVSFSRSIWSGDHRAPLTIAGMMLGIYGFGEGKRWAQILCFPVLLIGLQVHYGAWVLIPVLIPALIWLGWAKTTRKTLAIGIFLGALTFVPYTIGIIQTLSTDVDQASSLQVKQAGLSPRRLIKSSGIAVWVATGLGQEQYAARDNIAEFQAYIGVPTLIWILLGIAVALGVLNIWRYVPIKLAILILIWAFWPVLVFTVPFVDIFPHYFIPSIPAYSLLAGVGVIGILDWLKPRLSSARPVVWVACIAVFTTQGISDYAIVNYGDNHYSPSQFSSGTPIHYVMDVVEQLKSSTDVVFQPNVDWVAFSRTNSWTFAPFLHKTATCVRDILSTDNAAVLPSGPFTFVLGPHATSNQVLDSLYKVGSPIVVPLRPNEGEYQIYHFDKAPEWSEVLTALPPLRFENDVSLIGYRLDTNQLTLQWELPDAEKRNYRYSVTFLDAQGKQLTQTNANFWPSLNWCAKDTLATWVALNAPPTTTTIRVSMIHMNDELVRTLDNSGKVAKDWAEIDLKQK